MFEALTLPVEDPILILGIVLAVFLIAPLIFERFRLPGIIGIILVGVIIGPEQLNILEQDDTIVLLGSAGLLYLMFMAGLELDLNTFYKYFDRSLGFGAMTFLIPQIAGSVIFFFLGYELLAALLIASFFASHTLVPYPIITRLDLQKNEAVTTAVGATIVTDTVALVLLGVIAAAHLGDITGAFWMELVLSFGFFIAGLLVVLPRLSRWFFRNEAINPIGEYLFVLVTLYVACYIARLLGIEPILGAFLVGLLLNRYIPAQTPLNNRIVFFGEAFFIPFFLLYIGMYVDLALLLESVEVWIIMGAMVFTNMGAKYLASTAAMWQYDYSSNERWVMFGLTTNEAAATLAAVLVGLEIGLLGQEILNGVILMIMITVIIGTFFTDRYGRKLAAETVSATYDPEERVQRILTPVSTNPQLSRPLIDLAMVVREERFGEPIRAVTVRQPYEDGAEQEEEAAVEEGNNELVGPASLEVKVAQVREIHKHIREYGAAAAVPIESQVRVEQNIARGIQRAIVENEISTVAIGWGGTTSFAQRLFGTVIDQVLANTNQLTLVAKIRHPLNTTRRIVALLPGGIEHHAGFGDIVHTAKVISNRLDAGIEGLVVDGDADEMTTWFDQIEPDTPLKLRRMANWDRAYGWLDASVEPDDLVVAFSPREEARAWKAELKQLPYHLDRIVPESFVVIYPPESEPPRLEKFLEI